MAKLEDVFAAEADRQEPEKWSQIHLYKMGDFWRAYEWSAWLISAITYTEEARMTTKERRPLHITRMNRTDIEGTYCFVGFPVKSAEKYIPLRENFESVDDKHVVITITLPQPSDGSEITYDRLKEEMETWKEGIEIKERKKNNKPSEGAASAQITSPTGNGILSQIMAYPLSERTAIDNIQFIQSLKQQITSIL